MISLGIRSESGRLDEESVAGVGPNMNGDVPSRRGELSHRSDSRWVHRPAPPNSRQFQPRTLSVDRHHASEPRSIRVAIARSPIGPQLKTATGRPVPHRPGSPPACRRPGVRSAQRPVGPFRQRREQPSALATSRWSRSGVRPPSSPPLPRRPSSSSAGWTTTRSPGATPSPRGPSLDDARQLVTERHRPAGDPAHVNAGDVQPQMPQAAIRATASRGPVVVVGTSSRRRRGAVDPDLLHRPARASRIGRTAPSPHCWAVCRAGAHCVGPRPSGGPSGAPGCASLAAPKVPLQPPDRGGEGGGCCTSIGPLSGLQPEGPVMECVLCKLCGFLESQTVLQRSEQGI